MNSIDKSFLRCIQITSLLGLLALTLTQEIDGGFLAAAWAAYIAGLFAGRLPVFQARLRAAETYAVVLMVAMFGIDFWLRRLTFFQSIAHFLLLFQMYKWLGPKARKDGLQIFCFSFFQILSACTLSLDVWQAFIFIAIIPVSTMALFWHQIELQREESGRAPTPDERRPFARLARRMALASLPINLGLTFVVFMLFPRLTMNARLPGLSPNRSSYTDQVNLMQSGPIQEDDSVRLWLKRPSDEAAPWPGYLRGVALDGFDGQTWSDEVRPSTRALIREPGGTFRVQPAHGGQPVIRETITILNPDSDTLFTNGVVLRISAPLGSISEDDEGSFHGNDRRDRPLQYEIVSEITSDSDVSPNPPTERERAACLALPGMPMTRIAALAASVAGRGDAREKASRLENYLRRNFRYSLDYGERPARHPVEHFLFETRRGPCGPFASAMAVMLRSQGIPARIVAGYRKGTFNALAGLTMIRAKDAHAWVEAYIDGNGWIRFDPTPEIPAPTGLAFRLIERARQYWDFLQFEWNRLVLDYDLHSQVAAFERARHSSDRWSASLEGWWARHAARDRARAGANAAPDKKGTVERHWKTAAAVFVIAFAALFLWRARRAPPMKPQIFRYHQFLKAMSRKGCPKALSETGLEFAARVANTYPELHQRAWDVTNGYYEVRFRR